MKKNDESFLKNDHPQIPVMPFQPQGKEQIKFFKRGLQITVYDFYLIDEIGEPDKYLDLIHTLKTSESQDTVFIHINSRGGDLYTTVQILAAIQTAQAKVITTLEGQACSAATFIFLAGDCKMVNPNCTFMIHNYSQTTAGKGNEVVQHIGYMNDYFQRLAKDVYGDFLNDDELERVISGTDLWLHSHEVVDRLKKNDHEFIYTGEDLDLDLEVVTEVDNSGDIKVETKEVPKPRRAAKKKKTTKKK